MAFLLYYKKKGWDIMAKLQVSMDEVIQSLTTQIDQLNE